MELSDLLTEIPKYQTYLSAGVGLSLGVLSKSYQEITKYSRLEKQTPTYLMGLFGAIVAGFTIAVSQDGNLANHIVDQSAIILGYSASYLTTYLLKK